MTTRRDLLQAGALALTGASLGACRPAGDEYVLATAGIWRHAPGLPDSLQGLMQDLIRYATLAPSTYNSQCWQFRATRDTITILPDLERRSPAIDPDDHHLYISLGCAAENIVLIASELGLAGTVQVGDDARSAVTVRLELSVAGRSPIADAIPQRQTTRSLYNAKPVPAAELANLERLSRAPGVTPVFVTDVVQKKRLLDLAVAANRDWYADPAKVAELKGWTRFDDASALATRDGLAPGPAGRSSLPPALGGALFNLLAAADRENDRLVAEVRSSAGLVAFISAGNAPANWVETGRALQRFALLATSLGIRHAWVNAPVEVAAHRPQLGMELGEPAGRPGALLRFGYGPERPRSLRRPPPSN